MEKKFLVIFSMIALLASMNVVSAKTKTSPDLVKAIKAYKAQNYSECYYLLDDVLKEQPANALAYYYKAITSAQIGRKEEALANYEKVLLLSPGNNNLNSYAQKGKLCIEEPEKCADSVYGSEADDFILNKKSAKFSEKVQSDYERLQLENFMREMNRNDSVDTKKFENYKDFSSQNPSNDEIVAALRTLQRAGLTGSVGINSSYADLSILNGSQQQNSIYNMFGNSSMNPQIIQALLTNNMTQGF